MGIDEIGVLGDDNRRVPVRKAGDFAIRGLIALGETESVTGFVSQFVQADGEQAGKLRIDQEFHAAGRGSKRFTRLMRAA